MRNGCFIPGPKATNAETQRHPMVSVTSTSIITQFSQVLYISAVPTTLRTIPKNQRHLVGLRPGSEVGLHIHLVGPLSLELLQPCLLLDILHPPLFEVCDLPSLVSTCSSPEY